MLDRIYTVRALADVEVSDGTQFSTTVVYRDPQRAAFRSQDAGLAESVVIVTRGEVHPLSGEETLQSLRGILARTDYTLYDDLIRPVVRVSDDGTLGWVIVQVAARGLQLDEEGEHTSPLEFVSAWVELYEKVDGAWRMNGNVSNFRP